MLAAEGPLHMFLFSRACMIIGVQSLLPQDTLLQYMFAYNAVSKDTEIGYTPMPDDLAPRVAMLRFE